MRRDALHGLLRDGVHLAVLSSLAIAQPLFDLLGRNPEFFAVRGSTRWDVLVFAVAVVLVPPAALLLVEAAAALVDARARRAVHLLFVAGLTALLVLQVWNRRVDASGAAGLVLAALVGAAAAAAYSRVAPVRSFLTLLGPAPLVFAGLFLLASPVSRIVFPPEAEAHAAPVDATAPVVVVVFDELPTVSLLDGRAEIDASRFPSFAAVAEDATWFRNATTVHPKTEKAVPAILTGNLPEQGKLPTRADHPDNLFTLLQGSYELRALEAATHLCPRGACRGQETAPFGKRLGLLTSDLSVVYLHLVLPARLASRLPPVTQTWSDFRGRERGGGAAGTGRATGRGGCARQVCKFTDLLEPSRRPALYYFHAMLPHVPWQLLPSGRRYAQNPWLMPGLEPGGWTRDEWPTVLGYQRHLLQLGYADRALGRILDRLRELDLYDRSLVVVAADHGVSLRPGEPTRVVTPSNLEDIAFVPLLVKEPGQSEGRVEDGYARTVDILPTIAAALGVSLPWDVDGRSLLASDLPADGVVAVPSRDGTPVSASLAELVERRARTLERQVDLFGDGNGFAGVYGAGPNPELVGRPVAELRTAPGEESVELDGASMYASVDPSSPLSPSFVTGRISGSGSDADLAVAVNGVVAAVGRSFVQRERRGFAVVVPEEAFLAGANEVSVFEVRRDGAGLLLSELRGADLSFALERGEDGTVVRPSRGPAVPVRPGAVRGKLFVTVGGRAVSFSGWALDGSGSRAADRVLVFVDGQAVYAGATGSIDRKEARQRYGPTRSGFAFELPRSLLPAAGSGADVRVVAIAGEVASELPYPPDFPWGAG